MQQPNGGNCQRLRNASRVSTDVVPCTFPERTKHCMNGICYLIVVSTLQPQLRVIGSRPLRGRCEMFYLRDGFSLRRLTKNEILSGSTISQWSFSLAAHWQTMLRTFCSLH